MEKYTVRLSEPVVEAIGVIMEAEDRTFSNVVERVLKAALAGADGTVGRNAGRVGAPADEESKTSPPVPASTANATRGASKPDGEGTNGIAPPPSGKSFRPDFKGGKKK